MFENAGQRAASPFSCRPNTDGFFHRVDKDFSVADLPVLADFRIAAIVPLTCPSATTISILIFGRKSTVYSLPGKFPCGLFGGQTL